MGHTVRSPADICINPVGITEGGVDKLKVSLINNITAQLESLSRLDLSDVVEVINEIRRLLHKYSPFENEPVDYVQWINGDLVEANEYNPNVVAPPEMKLLELSIEADGYTQPIVAWERDGIYEVVDGFHRNKIGKESDIVRNRLNGYLPLVVINDKRDGVDDRMSSTIRHNRARGKHSIDGMAEIVIELKRRNWSDKKISKHLGMEPDEVLRLSQITGLADIFSDKEFSEAWIVEDIINEDDNLNDSEGEDEKDIH